MNLHPIIIQDIDEVLSSNLPWENLANSNILVTGANGFLASYLIYTFIQLNETRQSNIQVYGLVRNKEKAEKRFSSFLSRKDFHLIVQDVTTPIESNIIFNYIIHAASQASPKFYGVDPVGTLSANTIGTFNLLELARRQQTTGFLYFSTSEVYGAVDESMIPTKEDQYGYIDPMNVRSCYAESKRMGENICASFAHQYNIPIKVVRPFHTYGPGMDLNDGRVYADFVSDIVHNRNIEMKSDGLATRAFCYLSDATSGFFTVLLNGEVGNAYNVGATSCESSIINLAETLVGLFPEKGLTVIKKINPAGENSYLASKVLRNVPDTGKINSLGWQAKTTIEKGFMRTITSFNNA